ncbi:hypothetical protein HY971_00060 [Candidatus Kaiserbacteria bacterium]|nr:hypothetical protein [Candidatus Kaiserbacteria bacterium]
MSSSKSGSFAGNANRPVDQSGQTTTTSGSGTSGQKTDRKEVDIDDLPKVPPADGGYGLNW